MKTEKSSTTKKSSNLTKAQAIEGAAQIATEYIKNWTKKELIRLQTDKNPICIPINNGYLVGRFILANVEHSWQVSDSSRKIIHNFQHKLSAMLYATYTSKNQFVQADNLLMLDLEFSKHTNDIFSYKHHIARVLKSKNYDTYDALTARLNLSIMKLSVVEKKLKKAQNCAKYSKYLG